MNGPYKPYHIHRMWLIWHNDPIKPRPLTGCGFLVQQRPLHNESDYGQDDTYPADVVELLRDHRIALVEIQGHHTREGCHKPEEDVDKHPPAQSPLERPDQEEDDHDQPCPSRQLLYTTLFHL